MMANENLNSSTNEEGANASVGNTSGGQENEITNDLGNTTFTKEEIEQANKPQPNVILNETTGTGSFGSGYRDTERVAERANEASDSTDTNTGGIVAGAAKGTSQS